MYTYSVPCHGELSLMRPVLSLVSVSSLCLDFCLEDDQNPSLGLVSSNAVHRIHSARILSYLGYVLL